MKLRLLQAHEAETDTDVDFPPLSLEPPSLAIGEPAPVPQAPPPLEHREPDWHGRTARTQYRESEIYQPLGSILFGKLGGFGGRVALIVAIVVVYNAVLGWLTWDTWTSGLTTGDRVLVAATIAIGAAAGWIIADVERAYRTRSRMYG